MSESIDDIVGSSVEIEQLIRFAADGYVPKEMLAEALTPERRAAFLAACAEIERQFTATCAGQNDPCLESGCSIDGAAGETCLQPLLRAAIDYNRACAAEWMKLFRDQQNRAEGRRS